MKLPKNPRHKPAYRVDQQLKGLEVNQKEIILKSYASTELLVQNQVYLMPVNMVEIQSLLDSMGPVGNLNPEEPLARVSEQWVIQNDSGIY